MTTYRVAFDGKWQERFHDRAEALEWAKAVGDTGRLVYVARTGVTMKLIAVFPEYQAEDGKVIWKAYLRAAWRAGNAG